MASKIRLRASIARASGRSPEGRADRLERVGKPRRRIGGRWLGVEVLQCVQPGKQLVEHLHRDRCRRSRRRYSIGGASRRQSRSAACRAEAASALPAPGRCRCSGPNYRRADRLGRFDAVLGQYAVEFAIEGGQFAGQGLFDALQKRRPAGDAPAHLGAHFPRPWQTASGPAGRSAACSSGRRSRGGETQIKAPQGGGTDFTKTLGHFAEEDFQVELVVVTKVILDAVRPSAC